MYVCMRTFGGQTAGWLVLFVLNKTHTRAHTHIYRYTHLHIACRSAVLPLFHSVFFVVYFLFVLLLLFFAFILRFFSKSKSKMLLNTINRHSIGLVRIRFSTLSAQCAKFSVRFSVSLCCKLFSLC